MPCLATEIFSRFDRVVAIGQPELCLLKEFETMANSKSFLTSCGPFRRTIYNAKRKATILWGNDNSL